MTSRQTHPRDRLSESDRKPGAILTQLVTSLPHPVPQLTSMLPRRPRQGKKQCKTLQNASRIKLFDHRPWDPHSSEEAALTSQLAQNSRKLNQGHPTTPTAPSSEQTNSYRLASTAHTPSAEPYSLEREELCQENAGPCSHRYRVLKQHRS